MDFVSEYEQINNAISAAIGAAGADQAEILFNERDRARAAYTKATQMQLASNDAGMQEMVNGFTQTTQGLNDVSEAVSNLASYLGKIQNAVGWLEKIAEYAG